MHKACKGDRRTLEHIGYRTLPKVKSPIQDQPVKIPMLTSDQMGFPYTANEAHLNIKKPKEDAGNVDKVADQKTNEVVVYKMILKVSSPPVQDQPVNVPMLTSVRRNGRSLHSSKRRRPHEEAKKGCTQRA